MSSSCSYTLYNRICDSHFHKQYPRSVVGYASLADYFHGSDSKEKTAMIATPGLEHLPASIVDARNHNAHTCLFALLPTEILLMIEQYIDPPTIMTLRGCCARFMSLFADPTADANNIWEIANWRKEHTKRRRIYCLETLCREERDGSMAKKHLTCSACLASHHRAEFDDDLRCVEPERRLCQGYTRVLRLCEHKQVALASLNRHNPDIWCGEAHSQDDVNTAFLTRPNSRYQKDPRFVNAGYLHGQRGVRVGVVGEGVDEDGHAQSYGEHQDLQFEIANGREPTSVLKPQVPVTSATIWTYIKPCHPEVVMRTEVLLLKCDSSAKISNDDVVLALRTLKCGTSSRTAGSCPHFDIRTMIQRLYERPYTDCPNLCLHDESTRPCHPPANVSWLSRIYSSMGSTKEGKKECQTRYTCISCLTSFYVHRARYQVSPQEQRDELVLCIVRRLGACRNPFDPVWLTQLEDESLRFWAFKSEQYKEKVVKNANKWGGGYELCTVKCYPSWSNDLSQS